MIPAEHVPDLGPLFAGAQARGHTSVGVRCEERSTGGWSQTVCEGPDVMVRVEYHAVGRGSVSDEMRLDEAWKIPAAGLIVDKMSGPSSGTELALFMAKAFSPKARFVAFVIDQRESVGGLASRVQLPGGKTVAGETRRRISRFAQPQERRRGFNAIKEVGAANFRDLFDTGATLHLLEDPFRRGTTGFPLSSWSIQWFDEQDAHHHAGNFSQLDPLSRTATAAISAVVVETTGRTRANAPGSLLAPFLTDGGLGVGVPWASAVAVHKVDPLPAGWLQVVAACVSCGTWDRIVDHGGRWVCRRCWQMDNTARARSIEGTSLKDKPAAKDKRDGLRGPARRQPNADEMKPKRQRTMIDTTAILAVELASGTLPVEVALAELWPDDGCIQMARRWSALGLDDREITCLLGDGIGMTQREIGDMIHRDHRTVGRILAAGRKKLQK